MAPGQVGELGVQRGGPLRIVRDAPVDGDRRAVVGLEVVTEVLGAAEKVDPDGLAPGPDVGDLVAEQCRGRGPPGPTAAAAARRAGAAGRTASSSANIWPMKPSGVQLSRPMVPPGRHTRISSSALAWWNGANMTPRQDMTVSNSPSANGRSSASACRHSSVVPRRRGLPLPGLEQFRGQVAGYHAGPGLGGGDRGVAGSGGHVEHPVSGPDLARFDEDRAEARDEVGGHGRIVAERPHGAVLRLQRPARFGGIRGLGGHFGSPPLVVSGPDARKCGTRRLVQHLYSPR